MALCNGVFKQHRASRNNSVPSPASNSISPDSTKIDPRGCALVLRVSEDLHCLVLVPNARSYKLTAACASASSRLWRRYSRNSECNCFHTVTVTSPMLEKLDQSRVHGVSLPRGAAYSPCATPSLPRSLRRSFARRGRLTQEDRALPPGVTPGAAPATTQVQAATVTQKRPPTRDSHYKIARSAKAKSQFRKSHPCLSIGKTHGGYPGFVNRLTAIASVCIETKRLKALVPAESGSCLRATRDRQKRNSTPIARCYLQCRMRAIQGRPTVATQVKNIANRRIFHA